MAETRCVKVTLREGSLTEVLAWAEELKRCEEEVRATLAAEGVSFESVFLLKEQEGYALVYVMRAEDFAHARKIARSSDSHVDLYHEQFKKNCWLDVTPLERLIDFASSEVKSP